MLGAASAALEVRFLQPKGGPWSGWDADAAVRQGTGGHPHQLPSGLPASRHELTE